MPFPSPEDASGLWSMRDVCKHRETGAWPDSRLEVQFVVVGGGGGGGVIGGGGGGGGVRANWDNKNITTTWPYIQQGEPRMFLAPGTYPVIVGIGGNSGQQYTPATNGGDSSFNGIVAFGGGGGGSHITGTDRKNYRGKDGGSGGGGSDNTTVGGASLIRRFPGYQVPRSFVINYGVSSSIYPTRANFPASGYDFLIYRADDTQKLYTWTGSTYIETAPINITGAYSNTATSGGGQGQTGSYLYQTTQRYGGGGGGPGGSSQASPQDGGKPMNWCYNPSTYLTLSSGVSDGRKLRFGAGGGGGGYLSTTGGKAEGGGGGGGSVNSGTAGTSYWSNNNGVLYTDPTAQGQVGDNLIGGFGQPNRGGGGGGCSWQNPPITTHGGSGLVIIRYHGLQQATGGEIQTSTGLFRTGWTTHVFNSSGTFTVESTDKTGRLTVSAAPIAY